MHASQKCDSLLDVEDMNHEAQDATRVLSPFTWNLIVLQDGLAVGDGADAPGLADPELVAVVVAADRVVVADCDPMVVEVGAAVWLLNHDPAVDVGVDVGVYEVTIEVMVAMTS